VSASRRRARPGFERLLKGMATGEFSAIVCYDISRLMRRLDDTARLIDLAEQHGIDVETVAGGVDLSSGHGRGVAGVLGAVAAMETQTMSERHRSRKAQARRDGQMRGGGHRGYGFTSNKSGIVPDEAAVIQQVTKRVLAGESPSKVSREMNRDGLRTPGGGFWTLNQLLRTLRRPALAGLVTYRGQVVRDDHGDPVPGEWGQILTVAEYEELQIALAARKRSPVPGWSTNRKHLLSGLARCGLCGASMIGCMSSDKKVAYQCSAQRHLSRLKGTVDAYVISQVQAKAAATPITAEWDDKAGDDARRRLVELDARRHDAARRAALGEIPFDLMTTIEASLKEQISAIEESQVAARVDWNRYEAVRLEVDFTSSTLEEQRAAVEFYVQRIVIDPAPRGRSFDPDLVRIEWRDHDRYQWRAVVEAD
jgi:site-specific DNA recombinase